MRSDSLATGPGLVIVFELAALKQCQGPKALLGLRHVLIMCTRFDVLCGDARIPWLKSHCLHGWTGLQPLSTLKELSVSSNPLSASLVDVLEVAGQGLTMLLANNASLQGNISAGMLTSNQHCF